MTQQAGGDADESQPGAEVPRQWPLVLLAHRGPVSFDRDPRSGERTASRGSGGLVTALVGLAEHLDDAVWVCATSGDEDVAVAREAGGAAVEVVMSGTPHVLAPGQEPDGPTLCVRMVETDAQAHAAFYTVVSNPMLWFVQHGLYGLATAPVLTAAEHSAFDDGYVAVNEVFADAVVEEVRARGGRAVVLLQDYHFYLVAARVRQACPDSVINHFVHIPWPGPDAWRVLPPAMREPIVRGLLGADVVGFHTRRSARNFVQCAADLLGLPVDEDALTVTVGERTVRARWYPISVDPVALAATADGEEVAGHVRELTEHFLVDDRRLVLRVDRTDPSKNVVRGFLAFGTLLDEHPELVGRVSFLALLQPSRTDVPEYADYIASIGAVVAEVNARHTYAGVQPIDMRMVEDFALAVAAYTVCDVLMVNALADGMNLVAKEVAVVNRRDGVLALSENAGAHEELRDFSLTLHPFDVAQQAEALYRALNLPAEQRRALAEGAREQVTTHDVRRWLDAQMRDLAALEGD